MAATDPSTDLVLMTGMGGLIGTAVRVAMRPRWRRLRLVGRRPLADLAANEEMAVADIADRRAMTEAMQGVKAVVHLAAVTGSLDKPYDLEALFHSNARGLFDTFEAARLGGIRRIVFASSNHVFGCWPITERVNPTHAVRPDSLYGVFKVMAEAMLRYYYDRHGIASVSIRIGTCRALPVDQRSLATWLSMRDMAQMIERSLLHPDPGALVVNGYSANTRLKTHDPNWPFLGYVPEDNAEDHVDMLRAQGVDVDGPWEWKEHGGSMAQGPEKPPYPEE
jgi:uronate dehydrogenase